MVKNFKGIVKISDVQAEFDTLVQNINNAVDTYNSVDGIENIDYTKAGSTLAPLGYTLTIGGLKQFMELYDGYCFGCRVFKTGQNSCIPTNGVLVTKNKFYRIPSDLVSGYGTTLYYSPKTNKCQIGGVTSQTKAITFPAATSNNNPFNIIASYNGSEAYKAFNYVTGFNTGWNMGTQDTTLYGASNVLQQMNNGKNFDINANYFTRRLTFSYKTPITVKAGTILSYDIVPQKEHYNIASLMLTSGLFGLGINNSNILRVGALDGASGAIPDYSFSVTAPASNIIRVSYTFRKTIKFTSLTLGIAPYILWQGDNARNSCNLFVQNCRFSGVSPETTVLVSDDSDHSDLYKIADLNWEKTSSDNVWINDLPNSM